MMQRLPRISRIHCLNRRKELFEVQKQQFSISKSNHHDASTTATTPFSLSVLLEKVQNGSITTKDAEQMLKNHTYSNSDKNKNNNLTSLESFANLDHSRARRTGFPEAVFSSGKSASQIAAILDDMAGHVNTSIQQKSNDHEIQTVASTAILATRVDVTLYKEILNHPLQNGIITYHEMAKIISVQASALDNHDNKQMYATKPTHGKVVVACAGTTDLPVAEEAAVTLEAAGCVVERVYDVGVAGLHRIINALPRLRDPNVDCVIVCAGMDGALPSVVAGLVSVPVVAVPTSIGYGASFGGISAMLTMLNSCAPGVGVVNIDNGFGAAALAFKSIKRKSPNVDN